MKILHTADLHARDKDIDECRKVVNHLIDYAHARSGGLDLIVIAGDLTDRNDVRMDSDTARLIVDTISDLSMTAPVAILTGTKSHDGNIPTLLSKVKSYCPVYVASYPEQIVLTAKGDLEAPYAIFENDHPVALISFIPTPTKQYFSQQGDIEFTDQAVGEAMTSLFANFGANAAHLGLPHILIGHWQVGGSYISETQQLIGRDIEISTDQIMSAKPTVACLGHIHMRQQISSYPIFYSGSLYAKDFGELDPKGFYIHTIEHGSLPTSQFIQGPSRKMVKLSHNFTLNEEGLLEFDATMDLMMHGLIVEEAAGSHIRIELQAWQDEREMIDREKIEKFFLSAGAESVDVRIIPVPRQNARAKKVLEVRRLREKIEARAEITGDNLTDGILQKCDAIEETAREDLISGIKEVA
jgi:DNA repair exonuclease SbcCD nuclease subunit